MWSFDDEEMIREKYGEEPINLKITIQEKEKDNIPPIVKRANKENYEINLTFKMDNIVTPKRCVGVNTLYSVNKGNTYFLLDIDKITDGNTWTIHTNNYRYAFTSKYTRISDKQIPNDRFLISNFLTYWFRTQKVIPSKKRNYYFNRIRQLLVTQKRAIDNRKKGITLRNRNTKTFIKFSYKHTTFYLGFYEGCHCGLPAATVQSNDHFRCHVHGKEIIITPKNKSVQPNHREINKQRSKFVRSYRRNTQYVKSSLLVDEEIEGQHVKGLFTAKIFTSPLNPNKPVKEKDKETSIKLSKIHVKPINIGIQDLTIVDKELGII